MTKRLVDIDDEALAAARAELGTTTIRDTVNRALELAGGRRAARLQAALDTLAAFPYGDREDAWR